MLIRLGHEITISVAAPTHVVTVLATHSDRAGDLLAPERRWVTPNVPVGEYIDAFGNHCQRYTSPAGLLTFGSDAIVRDSGLPDVWVPEAREMEVERLPSETLQFLLGSRYCETDLLTPAAWSLFGSGPRGWARVQGIMEFVHNHLTFSYPDARPTRTAAQAYDERIGVCRDFAHLLIAFCRAMSIPARYVNGYLGDIGVPAVPDPMDFAAWVEVWLEGPDGGRWYTFDARNRVPRIGRVVIARGRDAADVPLINSFGPHGLTAFRVWADEITEEQAAEVWAA
jgi:transglutaminase-like putative cysteine protease